MKRLRYLLLVTCAALALPSAHAFATMADYVFAVSSGSAISPSWNNIWTGFWGGSRDSHAGLSTTVNLPFTFKFNDVSYTQISLSTHGLIQFGSSVSSSPSNDITSPNAPLLAPFWDALYLPGGAPNPGCNFSPAIRYGISGSAPNRVFVIDYEKVSREYCDDCRFGPMFMDFQVRLYEGSNRIEFFYESASATWPSCLQDWWGNGSTNTSATIGIASSRSDFLSVTPDGSTATTSLSTANNGVDLVNNTITAGTIYQFTPCFLIYTGNVAQGGTATMTSGDVLLSTKSVERGASATYQPFSINYNASSACATRNLTYVLSGPHASDYSITPNGLSPMAPGGTMTFNVTFTPSSIGVRSATLTINDPVSGPRVYPLRATGNPRISWTPDLNQGATPGLVSGDTLLQNIIVLRNDPRDFTPITFQNFSTNPTSLPAVLTFTIDSAGGPSTQYTLLTPGTVSLANGETHTPIIQFLGTGLGEQHATLTINADGEIRTFPLKAISGAPGIDITALGAPANPENPIFHQVFSCAGEYATVIPLQVLNPGQFPLTVTSIEMYRTDTTEKQGTPYFELVRDARGRVVPVLDYVISPVPGSAPIANNVPVPVPFVIDPGQTRTLYAVFVGQIPGRRFGRVFIRSNAQNAFGTDTTLNGVPNSNMGLLTIDLVGRSVGSQLNATTAGLPLKPIHFPITPVGDTSVMSFTIANTGACDLRINRNQLRIYSGDVNEFTMLTSLRRATLDAVTGDFMLAPGVVDTITVRFTPSRSGTRRATLWLQTNDSTLFNPGLSGRGSYYLDLNGRGQAGLDAHDLVLDPVVIGSFVDGVAVLENTLNTPIGIASINFAGDDFAEFAMDPARPWPSLPYDVLPGAKLELGVRLTPAAASSAGLRRTTLVLVSTTGDTSIVSIRGEAGTQDLVVSPNSLFEDVTIGVGETKRQMVMISNTGTLPVKITSLTIIGTDSLSYRMGLMPRRDLEAGQTEYVELAFAPSAIGQTSAQLVVTANNGQTYTVNLGGTALKIRRDPADPASTTAPAAEGTPEVRRDQGGTGARRPTLR